MDHRYLWAPRPFVERAVSWEEAHPRLAKILRNLGEDRVEELQRPGTSLSGIHSFLDELEERSAALASWGRLPRRAITSVRPHRKVAGRKWDQITGFAEAASLVRDSRARRWLDWCSGKGHLGRLLAEVTGAPVICVERDGALCEVGSEECADQAGVSFCRADVLRDEVDHLFDEETFAVALHACGDLGISLLRLGVRAGCPSLALATCCYQKVRGDYYEPMSEAGLRHPLPLHRHHLRLACFDEVVAPSGKRETRRREQRWRLAADTLIRRSTGRDEYTALGAFPRRVFNGTFEGFIGAVAKRTGLELSFEDLGSLEEEGARLLIEARALGLVRGMFKRAIESWLVLDRVLFLEESGYAVRVGEFCPFTVTPRNLMIVAERR